MTAPFGVHPKDEQRAEWMFHLAMREGATTEQIVREATRWLKTQGVTDESVARQIQRIKKFSANPMRKSRLESAWLITWEGTNPPKDQRKRVVSILSGRTSSERVREYVEQLHVDLLYSLHEKMTYARNRKANPYPAEFVRIDGVQWAGRITCGHNPHLAARKAKKPEDREDRAGWRNPSMGRSADTEETSVALIEKALSNSTPQADARGSAVPRKRGLWARAAGRGR